METNKFIADASEQAVKCASDVLYPSNYQNYSNCTILKLKDGRVFDHHVSKEMSQDWKTNLKFAFQSLFEKIYKGNPEHTVSRMSFFSEVIESILISFDGKSIVFESFEDFKNQKYKEIEN